MAGQSDRFTPRRFLRLAGIAAAAVLAIAAMMVIPPWVSTLVTPRGWRRIAIGFLWAVLLLQVVGAVAAPVGTIASVAWLARARRAGRSRAGAMRLLMLSASCLIGLGLLEAGAAAWRAWEFRAPPLPSEPALPTNFAGGGPASPGGEDLHLLVVGESSALGVPYDAWMSIGSIVAWQLERVFPGRRVSVEYRAHPGINLRPVHQEMATIGRRPDAVLVYSGHNEFQGVFPWDRVVPGYYRDTAPAVALPSLLERLGRQSNFGRMVLGAIDRRRVATPPPRRTTRQLVDVPVCTAEESSEILADYRGRLGAILAYCGRIGAVPIVVVPPSNLAGFEPNRSALRPETPAAGREAFARRFEEAHRAEVGDPAGAVAAYRRLVAEEPEFAEAHFRLARLLARDGARDEALRHFQLARDLDAMPQRCPSAFQAAVREAGAAHGAVVVDGPVVLGALLPDGLPDDRVFQDAHHPTFRGYVALAQDVLRQFQARRAFGWPEGRETPVIDPDECAAHFGIGPGVWAAVCRYGSKWYGSDAYIRHDPRERLERSRRCEAAADAIALGRPVAAVGIPGIGTHPHLDAFAFDWATPDRPRKIGPAREGSPVSGPGRADGARPGREGTAEAHRPG